MRDCKSYTLHKLKQHEDGQVDTRCLHVRMQVAIMVCTLTHVSDFISSNPNEV